MRISLLTLLLVAGLCPGCSPGPVDQATQAGDEDAEAEAIRRTVFHAQRGGFERHELDGFMAQWTDDAQLVIRRTEKDDQYERVIHRSQIEAVRALVYRGENLPFPSPKLKITYDEVRVEVSGERATLRARTTIRGDGGWEQAQENFRLRKTAQGWRIAGNLYWPIKWNSGDETIVYNDDTFKELDAAVEQARRQDDPRELGSALGDALRYAEAYRVAKKLTTRPDATPDDWYQCGFMAIQLGDADDAKRCFAKARSLESNSAVPEDTTPDEKE